MKMMKKMIVTGPRKTEIIEVPIPEINDEQMLVRVTLTGMCHSELYPWHTGTVSEIGHESVGVVERIGARVKGFKIGDRVTGLGGGAYFEKTETPIRYDKRTTLDDIIIFPAEMFEE